MLCKQAVILTSLLLTVANNKMPVIDNMTLYFQSDIKENVIEEVKYRKISTNIYSLKKEIDRIKSFSNEQELEDDNARRTLRQIFKEES